MPESLGKVLKKIRESKNLSLEDISERSRIPKYIISTIEEDRLSEIKSGFYAKSFVKTYASFLGAIDELAVKEYMAKGSNQAIQKRQDFSLKAKTRPADAAPARDFSAWFKYKKQILAIIIGLFVICAVLFALVQAVKVIKSISAKKEQNKTAKVLKKEDSKPAHKKAPEPKPKAPSNVQRLEMKPVVLYNSSNDNLRLKSGEAAKIDSVTLEITATGNTWIQVTGDERLLFTGSFKKGSSDNWKAKKEIRLKIGDSGAVKILVNGKAANLSGKKGEKKEIVITKDGIK